MRKDWPSDFDRSRSAGKVIACDVCQKQPRPDESLIVVSRSLSTRRLRLCAECAKKNAGHEVQIAGIVCVVTGLLMMATGRHAGAIASYGAALCCLPVLPIVAVLMHEIGHAVIAWALRYSVQEVCIGVGRVLFSLRICGIPVLLRGIPIAGYVRFIPPAVGRHRWRDALILLSGASVNLGCAAAVIWMFHNVDAFTDPPFGVCGVLGMFLLSVNAGVACSSLFPCRLPLSTGLAIRETDGMQILQLFRPKYEPPERGTGRDSI